MVNLSPGDLVTLTMIFRHGSSGNWNDWINMFRRANGEEGLLDTGIRVSPCVIDVALFLSGLFNVYVNSFNIIRK